MAKKTKRVRAKVTKPKFLEYYPSRKKALEYGRWIADQLGPGWKPDVLSTSSGADAVWMSKARCGGPSSSPFRRMLVGKDKYGWYATINTNHDYWVSSKRTTSPAAAVRDLTRRMHQFVVDAEWCENLVAKLPKGRR